MKFVLRLLNRVRLLRFFNISISFERKGKRVTVPIIRSLGSENLYLSELWMCEVLEKIIPLKKGIFIDVGVNVAQTLIKLKLVNGDMPYIGFDPNPVCIFYTKELIKANGFLNTQLVPVGISDKNEIVTLYFYADGDSDSSASIIKDFRTHKVYRQEHVPCFEYSHLQPIVNDEPVSIIKIDVEGAELLVLKGIQKLISAKRPCILIEILPVYTAENASRIARQNEIESLMKELDYKILRVGKHNGAFTSFVPLESLGITTLIEDSDYLLCPSELAHLVN